MTEKIGSNPGELDFVRVGGILLYKFVNLFRCCVFMAGFEHF